MSHVPIGSVSADTSSDVLQRSASRLVEMLRTDPQAAVRVLPTKSARPTRFASRVSA